MEKIKFIDKIDKITSFDSISNFNNLQYSEEYVSTNNKENSASRLLSIIFLHNWSRFIVVDFVMKSVPIIVFYFRCRMLLDSLTFELSSLAPLKEKKNENLDAWKKKKNDQKNVNEWRS